MPASECAVLALLAERPTHGFAIAQAMADDGEIGKVWSLRFIDSIIEAPAPPPANKRS